MLNTTERIAVMGGTFNPIHYAHLLSAEQVRTGLGYDKILFIPSARPPHKVADADIIAPEHRYQMVLLAIAENPNFEVSRIELDREGPSYTIETLKVLEKLYGNTRELGWIIGADSLIEYKIWKNFDEVLARCVMIATTRPSYDLNRVPSEIRNRVTTFPVTGVDISATVIRERIRKRLSIRYLVPETVRSYIYRHKLYH
ncbi:nicotinate-nucleotide adenylyltransferase [Candidatus Poribacteria bacterium]|nr:nicotinate-nucleotide adenylyltransferase [Candidatus Poribacteria bacterium]MXY27460.1 nicotinate-nucleotide adenylyltransferase [Candidatus Poribacteria bacterium]MYK18433.1 nicotinate-nucleotide adenylyltransferase [Candidatus Poribacteria bacterium]